MIKGYPFATHKIPSVFIKQPPLPSKLLSYNSHTLQPPAIITLENRFILLSCFLKHYYYSNFNKKHHYLISTANFRNPKLLSIKLTYYLQSTHLRSTRIATSKKVTITNTLPIINPGKATTSKNLNITVQHTELLRKQN